MELGKGCCSVCSRSLSVFSSGNVHTHGPWSNRCPGSNCPPANLLVGCDKESTDSDPTLLRSPNNVHHRSITPDENRMMEAFGATLAESHDCCDDVWYCRWKRVVAVCSIQYDLPGGSIGRKFVDMLSDEIRLFSRRVSKLERLIVFLSVMLQ